MLKVDTRDYSASQGKIDVMSLVVVMVERRIPNPSTGMIAMMYPEVVEM
jgi:hypothetical protein